MKRSGNLVVPEKIIAKPQQWFTFDSKNDLQLMQSNNLQSEVVEPYKFLCPKFRATYTNPYGLGVLSACFWPVAFKKGGLKFFVNFAEKYGMPYIIGKHKFKKTEEVEAFLGDLSNMIQDGVIAIGDNNQDVQVVPTGTTSNADIFDRLVNTMRKEIQAAVLNHDSAGASTAGQLGNNESALTASQSVVNSGKNLVQQTMNQLISWIFELNSMSGDKPRFIFYEEEDVDKEMAERDTTLAGGPVNNLFTKSYLKRAYGFEDEDIRDDAFNNKPALPALPPANFAEPELGKDQIAVDDIYQKIIDDGELIKLGANFVDKVLEYVDGKSNYEDAISDIASQYTKIDVEELQTLFKKSSAAAQTLGRHYANE